MNYKGLINQIAERVLNYERGGYVYFITLTVKDKVSEGSITKDTLSDFVKKLKYRGYDVVGYMWVKELQKRGIVHYHVLMLTSRRINFQVVDECWSKGFVFVQRVQGRNKNFRAIMNYLFKYLMKEVKNSTDEVKMRRRIGRGGVLRFKVEKFTERVVKFAEFDYVGGAYYKGMRVKIYRCKNLVMFVSSGMYGTKIDIFEGDISKIVEEFKYMKKWNGLARIVDNVRYLWLKKEEREEIIEYHKFDREINLVLKGV